MCSLPIGVATGFGTENRENQAEEECHKAQTDNGHNPSLANVTLS
jgi:hypothetical protein